MKEQCVILFACLQVVRAKERIETELKHQQDLSRSQNRSDSEGS